MSSRTPAGFLLTIPFVLMLAQASVGFAAEAKGDNADPGAKVQKLNRYAMQLFDDMNFALAEKTLLEALAIVEKTPSLAGGPADVSTNGNLAVLYSIGLKNPDKAVAHFKRALAVKPDLKMSKQRATPETESNLARAKAELAGGAPATRKPVAAASAAETGSQAQEPLEGGFKCPSDSEVPAGQDVTLKCLSAPDLKAAAVMLYYRPNNSDQYEAVQMTKSGMAGGNTVWTAKIPGSQTKAKWIPVYFEARDGKGGTLAQSGREDSPNVIVVKGGEAAASAPVAKSDGDEEGDEEEEEESDIDDDNPLARLEKERRREHEGSKGTFWVGLGFGSGFGYASGKKTEAYGKYGVAFQSGFAPALLGQAVPELGYFIGRNTAVALAGRLQAIFPRGPEGTATGALTALLRLMFYTEDDSKVRWYFSLAGGAGEGFRFQLETQLLNSDGSPKVDSNGNPIKPKDTVRGGPFVAGAGTGMEYKLGRHARWTIDTQVLVGFPNVSAVLDLGTGLRYLF